MGTFIKTIKIITITALMLAWVNVQPVYAASIVVNTNADNTTAGDGFCTLREAINNANSDSDTTSSDCFSGAGADIISFAGNYVITLAGSQLPVITTTITINGNSPTNTILQANANPNVATNRIFEVSSTGNLTLNDLTVRNGRCNGTCPTNTNNGGGIYTAGALTLTNSTVSANVADTDASTDGGGGIYGTSNATITITDSTISNNIANCIGVIFCGGGGLKGGNSINITNSAISSNMAICVLHVVSYCDGGGIYNGTPAATINISNSIISNNAAGNASGGTIYGGSGGGIVSFGGTLSIINSTFSGNLATDGGAIFNGSTLTVTNSTFENNSVLDYGSSLYTNNGTVTGSTFSNNHAGGYGGSIFKTGSGTLTITSSMFSSNQAYEGGGIYNWSGLALNITDSTISGNLATNGGGGIANGNGPFSNNFMTVTSSTISGNSAPIGGGIYNTYPSTLTVTNSSFANNSADVDGGGIFNDYRLTVMYSTFSNNSASAGGGIYTSINNSAETNLYSTIVANSPSGSNCVQPADGSLNANNTNIDTDGSCDNATQRTSAQVNLRPLADNGGDTQTMALGTGSLAIDAGDPTVCANSPVNGEDQRGVARPQGTGCDVGAYEVDVFAPPSALPDTGFAPNRITVIPAQPTNLAYTDLGAVWLEIPSLKVTTEIVGVPQSSNGWDVDWLGQSAGWLNGTAFPSWEGNSVLTGHVYDANGKMGPFANIKNLKHGDQIIVHLLGEKYIFEVRTSDMLSPSNTKTALEHLEGHSYLTLITCQGYNPFSDSYFFRRVVRAVLVDVQAE